MSPVAPSAVRTLSEMYFRVLFLLPRVGDNSMQLHGWDQEKALKLPTLDQLNSVWNGVLLDATARGHIHDGDRPASNSGLSVNVLQRFCTAARGSF